MADTAPPWVHAIADNLQRNVRHMRSELSTVYLSEHDESILLDFLNHMETLIQQLQERQGG